MSRLGFQNADKYNIMGTMTTTAKEKAMSYFEEVARAIISRYKIDNYSDAVSALQQAGMARFAAKRQASKIFKGKSGIDNQPRI